VLCIGAPDQWGKHLGQSVWLREILGREDGPPPPVDLAHEKKIGDFVRALVRDGTATAVHDISDGGIAVALAEMAMASGIGVTTTELNDVEPVESFFGEDQGRYLLTIREDDLDRVHEAAEEAGIFAPWIGRTGGTDVVLGEAQPVPVAKLRAAHENWFPAFMAGP
jgi:phosphoribosylformylglycinamidine synthase